MFQRIYEQQAFRKSGITIAEVADGKKSGFAETIESVRQRGGLAANDPRLNLDAAQIQKFSEMNSDELMRIYGSLAASMCNNPNDRDARIRGAAVMRMMRQQRSEMQRASSSPSKQAQVAEASALSLARANPEDTQARDMLMIAAAMSDRAQRDRVMQGFETRDGVGNISKAAKAQGRSWLEVRDDLVRFNVLSPKDPRRKVLAADVEMQRGRGVSARSILDPVALESQAMSELKKDPANPQARAWLATTGALQGDKQAKQVKEIKGPLPKRKSLAGYIGDIEM